MTPETQTGAYQKIPPDDHAPAESPLGLDGRLAGGTDRGEQLAQSTQPTKTADTHATPTRHHTNQTLIALTPAVVQASNNHDREVGREARPARTTVAPTSTNASGSTKSASARSPMNRNAMA